MAKIKQAKTNNSSPSTEVKNKSITEKSMMKWIIVGVALLLIFGFMLYKMLPADDKTEISALPETGSDETTSIDEQKSAPVNTPPPISHTDDLAQKIPGDWYVTDRLIDGKSTTASGKLSKGSWQFYEDGSLKFTTTQYSDLGTWKFENGKFNVSLFALGKYPGYISEMDKKSMVWVTTETIDGSQILVTNRLSRSK